jgi:competence protein CoiA
MIKYGLHKETNLPVFIDDALNGLKCKCKCFECGGDLVANQGQKMDHFFDHYISCDCKGAPETAIHKLAKTIVAKNLRILSPKGWIDYTDAELEIDLGFLRPDIVINAGERKIYIEICVSNMKKEKQIALFEAHRLTSFEINLSNIPYDISPEELEPIILNEMSNRYLLYWHEEIAPVIEIPKSEVKVIPRVINNHKEESIWMRIESFIKENIVSIVFVLLIAVLGFAITNRPRRNYRK